MPIETPPRSFASLRHTLEAEPLRPRLFRGLDHIANLNEHMTRRGVVQAFVTGMSGLLLACDADGNPRRPGRRGGPTTPPEAAVPTTTSATLGFTPPGRPDGTPIEQTTPEEVDCDPGAPPAGAPGFDVGAFVHIDTDGRVTVAIPKNEMGQGIATALAMAVAEELDVAWEDVDVRLVAELDEYDLPGWVNGTWGSLSVSTHIPDLQEIGATARAMLLQAAAARWSVDPSELSTEDGVVSHPDHGALSYGELSEEAAAQPVPATPALKDPADHKILGTDRTRVDTRGHVEGRTVYGIDATVPGMVYAAIRQSPVFGGVCVNFDMLDVTGTGAAAVVEIPGGIAVVADSWWVANKVVHELEPIFEAPQRMETLSTQQMRDEFATNLDRFGLTAESRGDVDNALARSELTVEAEYEAPMLTHVAMEPLACLAEVRPDGAELWIGTQFAAGVRTAVARQTGLPEASITIHTFPMGGAFGRRAETDFAIQAVVIAEAFGAPVKLIWSREEDVQHSYYRPPVRSRITGGLSNDRLVAWSAKAAGCSYFLAEAPFNAAGFDDPPYAIPNLKVTWKGSDFGLPFGYLRQPGPNKYHFMIESFVDECAHAIGADPAEFRLSQIDRPRLWTVLDRVLAMADWGAPTEPGASHGVSVSDIGGHTLLAQVAEVSVDGANKVRVHRVWCAIDAGIVINPDIVRAQIEGCIIFSLATGVYGEITLASGRVEQSNFHNYKLIGMRDAPAIEVEIIESSEPSGGVGEHAVGGLIPAVTNAIFAATGVRIRDLPITRHGFS